MNIKICLDKKQKKSNKSGGRQMRIMLYSYCYNRMKKVGCISDVVALWNTKEGDAHEYDGSIDFAITYFCGTILYR